MSLLKKIGEWTLATFPLWGIASIITYDVLAHKIGGTVEYRQPYGNTVIGPLPLSALESVHYSVWQRGTSVEVSTGSVMGVTSLIDSNDDSTLDKKRFRFGVPRRPVITIDLPITTEDQALFMRIVTKVKNQ